MSSAIQQSVGDRFGQLLALGVVFAVLYLATLASQGEVSSLAIIAAVGFLLLAGMLTSDVLGALKLPHLTGYIAAGVLAGPHVLHLIDHETVVKLEIVNTLTLALIALAGGAELRLEALRTTLRSLLYATLFQSTLVLVGTTALFVALSSQLPFAQGLELGTIFGIAILWGVLSVSRSPSATLAILSQSKAKGPVATFSLGFVMSSDVVVILLLALAFAVVRPLIDPAAVFSLGDIVNLGHEIVGSVSLGTTLGLLLSIYLRFLGRQPLLVLLAIGYGATEVLRYMHFDPLLTFLIAGFFVENVGGQGKKLLEAVEQTSSVVFIVFFATTGAHLDIPLVQTLWPLALAFAAGRAVLTIVAHRISSKVAGDPPEVSTWGWTSLVSQAGLTLGLAVTIERAFPSFGSGLRSMVIATVAINEIVGPILFKLGLDRSGATAYEATPETEARAK